jgi:hypothetical protein
MWFLLKGDFIIFGDRPTKWPIVAKKNQNMHTQLINMNCKKMYDQ